ncbi:MAG TPA: hypothetical protein VHT29_08955 [Solirubrobacteraceae bacterium]|jgi:hypothetical protein|nr:hypothetical protein [Solirubrobacteraceae bacterium]
MRSNVRFSLLALVVSALVAVAAPAAQAAESLGIAGFVAVNCKSNAEVAGAEECAQKGTAPFSEPNQGLTAGEAKVEGYTQAGGHIPNGITDFKIATIGEYAAGEAIPTALVKHIRTDVAPGLATNPTAVPQCSLAEFGETEVAKGLFAAPACNANTIIGKNKVVVYVGVVEGKPTDVPLEGTVYNLVPSPGRASEFGVALNAAALAKGAPVFAHTLIEGNVEWAKEPNGTGKGDYHDYFEINVNPELPLIRSRLTFEGRKGGDFLTNGTSCPGNTTTTLKLTDVEGTTVPGTYTTPLGLENCGIVPFEPSFSLFPGESGHDEPDGITTEVGVAQHSGAEELNGSQLKTAVIKLPEGMTLNPSAAAGLTACTPNQARIHSLPAGTSCPSSSELGTVSLNVPTLPNGSLTGKVYLGGPEGGTITKPPYTIYVDAESARYGVSVRLEGEVVPNEATGQLTTTFKENPEQPFTNIKLQFKAGPLAPIANPLTCGKVSAEGTFTPYTLTGDKLVTSAFSPTGCANPIPFAPTQGTSNQTANAGAATSFTVSLVRPEGNQYLSHVSTTLPPGLVGRIPTVPLCPEAQAAAGTCEAPSAIGTANVQSGSGPTPFNLSGTAYLTGPYNGAPYGIDVQVPVVAGPFNLGSALTRLGLYVNQETGAVTAAGYLPSIVYGGVPTRLRQVSISINRQGFMTNPTNCGTLATQSTLTGSLGASATVSTPFQVGNCNALAFKPAFKAAAGANTSKKYGASLETTINQPAGEANIKSVVVQLPKQLPSRLATLHKACPEATFKVNPYNCPSGSFVGGVRANTPVLPAKMKGPAILVSHGGAAFPDLDLVLEGNGVRVILVGNTNIKNGITTTTFASTPDVPVSSITVNLPIGEHSALAAYGNVCTTPLIMPTTITGQNGVVVKQNTKITAAGCGVQIVGHKVIGNTAYLTVSTPAAGRISGSGSRLGTVYRYLGGATKATTLKVPLRRGGRRPFQVRVRVGFLPKQRSRGSSASTVTVTFR